MTAQMPFVPMPDVQTFLLPGRAYMLSLRDQTIPLRRAALEDAALYEEETRARSVHARQLAVVALIGEALQVIEDVAAVSNSLLHSPQGIGFFATAASYSERAINNFYGKLRNQQPEELLALLGLQLGGVPVEDFFVTEGGHERQLAHLLYRAIEAGDAASIARVREVLTDDAVLLRLLRSCLSESRSQTLGDVAVRSTPTLQWPLIAELVGDETPLVARVQALAASVDRSQLDGRTVEALDLALRYATGDPPTDD